MSEANSHPNAKGEGKYGGKLLPTLRLRDLILFYVVAIFSIRLLPAAAAAGPGIVVFFLISLVIFFIPMGLTVVNLSKRYPVDGAIYIWAKEAFGDFHGYITAWTYWTASLAFFPSLLFFISSQLVHIIPAFQQFDGNPMFLSLLSTITVLGILVLNIVGLKVSTVFNNLSAISTYLIVLIIIVVGALSWAKFGPATDLSFKNWVPSFSGLKDLVFLSTVVYLFAGLESASLLGDEVQNARKTIPRAIAISGLIISLMYIATSFGLLVSVPSDALSNLTGISDAVGLGAGKLNGDEASGFFANLSSILLIMMSLGGLSVWLTSTARLPFVVGLDSYLPPAFGKLHPRFGTPYISLIALVLMTILLVVLSGLGEKAEQIYHILISLEIIVFLIPYLYMFAAVVKFEVSKRYRNQVNIPGGNKNAILAGIVGFLVIAASLLLALVPGDDVENPVRFYFTVLFSLAMNTGIGIFLYYYAKRKRRG